MSSHLPWYYRADSSVTPGIVICIRDDNVITAIHLICSLRNVLQSTLPIDIAFAGNDDLSPADQALLEDLGSDMEPRNLLHLFDDATSGLSKGTSALKPFAVLASPFQKTILIDVGAVFMQTPHSLFNTEPGLIESGILFWHDHAYIQKPDGRRHARVRGLLKGRRPRETLNGSLFWNDDVYDEMDAGVICMDKGRLGVITSLVFAVWVNTKHVREQITYKYVDGDKERYWLASELSGSPYYFHPSYASVVGVSRPETPSQICSSYSLNLDFLQRTLWLSGSSQHQNDSEPFNLTEPTYWISGTPNMNGQISRKPSKNNTATWCPSGGPITPMEGSGYWDRLLDILEEARKVNMEYPGLRTEVTGKAAKLRLSPL